MIGLFGTVLSTCTKQAPVEGPSLSWTPFPTQTPAVETAAPTVQEVEGPAPAITDCVNDATFLEDLSLPDGIVAVPGQILEKRWSVQNSGTCDWGPGYTLAPMWDNPFLDAGVQGLYPARAGATAMWSVEIVAPQVAGTIFARWQALDPDGEPFGDEVYLLIEVVAPETTETAAPTIDLGSEDEGET